MRAQGCPSLREVASHQLLEAVALALMRELTLTSDGKSGRGGSPRHGLKGLGQVQSEGQGM